MIKWIFNLSHSKKDNKPLTKDDINVDIKVSKSTTMDFSTRYLFTQKDIEERTQNGILSTKDNEVIIRGDYDVNLKGINKVSANLGIINYKIDSLEDIKAVDGDLWFGNTTYKPKIRSLGKLEIVNGKLNVPFYIENIGSLKRVEGNLNLKDSEIKSLNNLEYVGGDLLIHSDFNLKDETLEVIGKIKRYKKRIVKTYKNKKTNYLTNYSIPYWKQVYIYSYEVIDEVSDDIRDFYYNDFKKGFKSEKFIDLKGSDNYAFTLMLETIKELQSNQIDISDFIKTMENLEEWYPSTESYIQTELVTQLEKIGLWEAAWKYIDKYNKIIDIGKYYYYSKKVKIDFINKENIFRIINYNPLTNFGKENIDEVMEFFEKSLKTKLYDFNCNTIWKIFLKNEDPIQIYEFSYYHKFLRDNFDLENPYFSNQDPIINDFKFNNISYEELKIFPSILKYSIIYFLVDTIIDSENLYRVSIGLEKIGEGIRWKSEYELFELIKGEFSSEEIIHQARPKWLGLQSFDIYLPEKNIAIEYQGQQHYQSIDFFGGDEALKKTIERDELKKKKAEENDCILILVDYGYSWESLRKLINDQIEIRKDYSKVTEYKKSKTQIRNNSNVLESENKLIRVKPDDQRIFDFKSNSFISFDELKKVKKEIKFEYFIQQDSVFGRYTLESKLSQSKLNKTWRTIKDLETDELERHSLKSFAEKVNTTQNSVWRFFNNKQKKFAKRYVIVDSEEI